MKIGWSLGNTLDAGNESNRGQDPGSIEKSWGNPDTTKEMIDEIKKAGSMFCVFPQRGTGAQAKLRSIR